ncbi:MAG TPA: DUF6036 family nucleotidyltransferase [Gemmatimonadales bacterium]|jgi:hypothetical protein
MLTGKSGVESALQAVGELLAAEGQQAAIVIVGGSALNLRGVTDRATRDVDIIALASLPGERLTDPGPTLGAPLARAASLVAQRLGLHANWLNQDVALQWKQGLPPAFEKRVDWRQYSALSVGVAGRKDLIFLKLYAAADAKGPDSVHFQDLLRLSPTAAELKAAAAWVSQQDQSPEFHRVLTEVTGHAARARE